MTRAWYGVVPTGAQAAVAIRLLAELSSSDHPELSMFYPKIFMWMTSTLARKLRLSEINRFLQPNQYCNKEDLALNTRFKVDENPEK